jgi:hypothetical protein
MTIECYISIYGIGVWFLDDGGCSIKFRFSYRNDQYYIKSHNPIRFTVFNFGEEK